MFKIEIAHGRHSVKVARHILNFQSNNFVSDVNYQNNQVSFATRALIGPQAKCIHLIGRERWSMSIFKKFLVSSVYW